LYPHQGKINKKDNIDLKVLSNQWKLFFIRTQTSNHIEQQIHLDRNGKIISFTIKEIKNVKQWLTE